MTICGEYFAGYPGLIPKRIRRANPRAIETRFVQYVLSMDLTPEPDDDDTLELGAWSLWDLPISTCAQIPDDTGDDLITVSIKDRIYVLDWTRFRDEWGWEVYGNIYRRLTFAPIPSSQDAVDGPGSPDSYRKHMLHRFRRCWFDFDTAPTAGSESKFRITVNPTNDYSRFKQGIFEANKRNSVNIALSNAIDFEVTIEHEANEQFDPRFFTMGWDTQGNRFRSNRGTT